MDFGQRGVILTLGEVRSREFARKHKTDEQIQAAMAEEKEGLEVWKKDRRDMARMQKDGKPLEDIYDWEGNWEELYYKVSEIVPDEELDDDEKSTTAFRMAIQMCSPGL